VVAGIVFLIGLPPVIVAFRAIANRRHRLVFIASWLLPLPLLFLLLFVNELLFGANGIGTQSPSFLGIALIVLVTDLVVSVFLIRLTPQYLSLQEEA
jgi:hypothetical protein